MEVHCVFFCISHCQFCSPPLHSYMFTDMLFLFAHDLFCFEGIGFPWLDVFILNLTYWSFFHSRINSQGGTIANPWARAERYPRDCLFRGGTLASMLPTACWQICHGYGQAQIEASNGRSSKIRITDPQSSSTIPNNPRPFTRRAPRQLLYIQNACVLFLRPLGIKLFLHIELQLQSWITTNTVFLISSGAFDISLIGMVTLRIWHVTWGFRCYWHWWFIVCLGRSCCWW